MGMELRVQDGSSRVPLGPTPMEGREGSRPGQGEMVSCDACSMMTSTDLIGALGSEQVHWPEWLGPSHATLIYHQSRQCRQGMTSGEVALRRSQGVGGGCQLEAARPSLRGDLHDMYSVHPVRNPRLEEVVTYLSRKG